MNIVNAAENYSRDPVLCIFLGVNMHLGPDTLWPSVATYRGGLRLRWCPTLVSELNELFTVVTLIYTIYLNNDLYKYSSFLVIIIYVYGIHDSRKSSCNKVCTLCRVNLALQSQH